MELIYPNIPFAPDINNCVGPDCLAKFISYWFGFAIMLGGTIALISLVVAGIRFISSAGNTSAVTDAKDRIKSSIFGLVLLLASFLILRTINPVFVTPIVTPLGEVPGIFYTNGPDTKPAPISESDTANIPQGFNQLIYKCPKDSSQNLYIWFFPGKNFSGDLSAVSVYEVNCQTGAFPINAGSFKIAFKTPGIYYKTGKGCTGHMSNAVTSSEYEISEPFKGRIKSIWVVNDIPNNIRYGAIFHRNIDYERGGSCSAPLIDVNNLSNTDYCIEIPSNFTYASSVSIFSWNPVNPQSSGSGVEFYSKPFGWNVGEQAGNFILNPFGDEKYGINKYWSSRADLMDFDYSSSSVTEQEQNACKTFMQCTGSVRLKGSYVAALYTKLQDNSLYCQVFTKDVSNLKLKEFIGAKNQVQGVYVFPVK